MGPGLSSHYLREARDASVSGGHGNNLGAGSLVFRELFKVVEKSVSTP